jgi:hypothetical protein
VTGNNTALQHVPAAQPMADEGQSAVECELLEPTETFRSSHLKMNSTTAIPPVLSVRSLALTNLRCHWRITGRLVQAQVLLRVA